MLKTLDLYHGTKNISPDLIFTTEEGFDLRFSPGGLWGKAIYFSVNSSYSNAYAHLLPNGQKQIFLAKVIIGNEATLNPDPSLVMPPLNEESKLRYDSVKGRTGGSDIYMVYANKRAYPQYLITYI